MTGLVVAAIFLACFTTTSDCQAQKKYPDPFHPKVQRIADGAVKFLEANPGAEKESAICALAVVEYYKRYDGSVPKDNQMVSSTVSHIAKMIDSKSNEMFQNREIYFPCLAMILLAEYDAETYSTQISAMVDMLVDRQMENTGAFSYLNDSISDTSQSQFAALAFFVARQHKIPVPPEAVERLLTFFVDYQSPDGSWAYRPRSVGSGGGAKTNSIHSASLSSVYLLGDLLRLQPRVKDMSATGGDSSLGLPKNVTIYIPPKGKKEAESEEIWGGPDDGPVVNFGRGKLASCKSGGNSWYSGQFRFPIDRWNSYFMYALERYAFFKEQAEGNVGGALRSWYDDGVDYIEEWQDDNGAIVGHKRVTNMPVNVNTAFSLLFLVRASEIISLPPVDTELVGAQGFEAGELREGPGGSIVSSEAEQSLEALIDALQNDKVNEQQLQQISNAMKRAVREFKQTGEKSRGEVTAFLKTMISERNYYRRLVAIKFLAGEQDMDNVPALLYAMGDPDPVIAEQAHNGLRLISRKFDTFVYENKGNKEDNLLEFSRLKKQWTKWYLEIRPDAELLE